MRDDSTDDLFQMMGMDDIYQIPSVVYVHTGQSNSDVVTLAEPSDKAFYIDNDTMSVH
mgnify:CR=1 FL=1